MVEVIGQFFLRIPKTENVSIFVNSSLNFKVNIIVVHVYSFDSGVIFLGDAFLLITTTGSKF